jgi:DNA polymerase-3 subunit chi
VSRVEFYVLTEAGDAVVRHACRLAEQAVELGQRVYIQTANSGATARLDELLWTFDDRSFLPHEIAGDAAPSHPRVMILLGEQPAPAGFGELLINLTDSLPPELDRHERIAELVSADAEHKRLMRERYKLYRERGCEMVSNNVE